ncbi:MAG: histidine phosphatase family protein [Gemmatimonadota bacterium]|nr:histidine phosphatase family protein [Gemmatimonadota bacterium]
MKRLIMALVLGVGLGLPAALVGAQDGPAMVILVRHAEKADEPQGDPDLNEAGRERAQELARVLGDAGISAVYSTPFKRTTQTAAPIAESLGLQVNLTPISATFIRDLAETIVSDHAGETVLVVGHSNTVPQVIRALGGDETIRISEDEYDDLFIVSFQGGTASLVRLHYGGVTP